MAKKITGYVKLQVPAGKAAPAPPVGPALGQAGLNIMEFCKAFNAETQQMEQGAPLPVVITVYADKTFSFVYKKPPASYLIMKAINIKKASTAPGRDAPIAKISRKQLEEIAQNKMSDLNAHTIDDACKILAGTARSMGIEVME
ncbi:MAG: 50S ribosomal protein L11 [Pelagibacterales bacterium]|jgi:large subunit ribosomal protein L11|nr:50S ribosomal protein L11 [Pelagibacterales bacterium]